MTITMTNSLFHMTYILSVIHCHKTYKCIHNVLLKFSSDSLLHDIKSDIINVLLLLS